jgi:hypothetical protein
VLNNGGYVNCIDLSTYVWQERYGHVRPGRSDISVAWIFIWELG